LADASTVIAVGGGAFAQARNAKLLEDARLPAVFLDAPAEELFRRCQEQAHLNRPLRRDLNEFRRLYEERRPFYLRAGLRVETSGKSVDRVVDEVVLGLGLS